MCNYRHEVFKAQCRAGKIVSLCINETDLYLALYRAFKNSLSVEILKQVSRNEWIMKKLIKKEKDPGKTQEKTHEVPSCSGFSKELVQDLNDAAATFDAESVRIAMNQKGYWMGSEYVFEFIREIFAVMNMHGALKRDVNPEKLKPLLVRWHRANEEYIKEHTNTDMKESGFDAYWLQFISLWEKVEETEESRNIAILKKAEAEMPPEAYQFEDEKIQLLCSIAYHLQQQGPNNPFPFSSIQWGKMVKRSATWVAQIQNGFIKSGILVFVRKKGLYCPREFRYHGRKLDEESK